MKKAQGRFAHMLEPTTANDVLVARKKREEYDRTIAQRQRMGKQMEEKKKCGASLLEMRNWLKLQVEDEQMAFSQYNEASAKFSHFAREQTTFSKGFIDRYAESQKLDDFSSHLHLIAGQELNHKIIIEEMVKYITEKCGE